MEDTSFVPRDLQYDQVTPGNEAELSPCILFLYDKLHVEIVQEGDDLVYYQGLPEELQEFLFNYSNEELLQDPVNVVQSIIRM